MVQLRSLVYVNNTLFLILSINNRFRFFHVEDFKHRVKTWNFSSEDNNWDEHDTSIEFMDDASVNVNKIIINKGVPLIRITCGDETFAIDRNVILQRFSMYTIAIYIERIYGNFDYIENSFRRGSNKNIVIYKKYIDINATEAISDSYLETLVRDNVLKGYNKIKDDEIDALFVSHACLSEETLLDRLMEFDNNYKYYYFYQSCVLKDEDINTFIGVLRVKMNIVYDKLNNTLVLDL